MKKIKFAVFAAMALLICCSVAPLSSVSAAETIGILEVPQDWVRFSEKSTIDLSSISKVRHLKMKPVDGQVGAIYQGELAKSGVIQFKYQINYNTGRTQMSEDMGKLLPGSFWGISFLNVLDIAPGASIPSNYIQPWTGRGGSPYMLCFDTERQTTSDSSRYEQVGLSLRRYGVLGSHAYAARWSTVNPTEEEYIVSTGDIAYSKIPFFSVPVNVSDCFDTAEHDIKLDFQNRYKLNGDEFDGVEIKVWFDEELVLHVKDEMPLDDGGEFWGIPIVLDKREEDGYLQFWAHHDANASTAAAYNWEVDIWDCNLEVLEGSTPVKPNPPVNTNNCTKSASLSIIIPLAGMGFLLKPCNKKEQEK